MQLYKSRGFSEYFSDTFLFVKKNGKHFFKNYFTIAGIPIVILMVLSYFFMKFYTEFLQNNILNSANTNLFENYINENGVLFIIIAIIFFIIALIIGVLNFSYTPIYLNLYEEYDGNNFGTKEIINSYKKNITKIILFVFASFLVAIPTVIIAGLVMTVLFIIIVGIPLILLVISLLSLFYHSAFLEYLQTKKGVFECFSYSLSLCFKKFWAAIGCVALFFLIIQVVQTIITLIPYLIGIFTMIVDSQNDINNQEGNLTTMMTLMLFTYLISFLLSIILTTFTQLNQGIIFFSLKEENENINTKSDIEQIGTSVD